MLYFEWQTRLEKNNCVLAGVEVGEVEEMSRGQPLAKLRTAPYQYPMDDEYKKNVRLTDSLVNDQRSIVASERLRDLFLSRLGEKIEVLPVWIKDHKGRIATKTYSFINILDVQACLATDRSIPFFGTINGQKVLLGVQDLTLELEKVSPDAMLFRTAELKGPILIREDLMEEVRVAKLVGMRFRPVKTV